uniref:Uncharacterized protein n=1 Tax=Cannabis sativa TaxID=3483 RepID=A0A803P6C5_CANSA
MIATRTTITKPTTRDGDTTMDDVNPPPTTHVETSVVGEGETSEPEKEVPEKNAPDEPTLEENNTTKKVNPMNVGPFVPVRENEKGIMEEPANKNVVDAPRKNKNAANQPLQKTKAANALG